METKCTIDFDILREEEEVSFLLGGIKYIIPPVTYDLLLKIAVKDKQLNKAIKANDIQQVVECSIEIACLAVPDLKAAKLKSTTSVSEIRRIGELINKSTLGTAIDPEVEFYRDKYEDEYRKNLLSTREKR